MRQWGKGATRVHEFPGNGKRDPAPRIRPRSASCFESKKGKDAMKSGKTIKRGGGVKRKIDHYSGAEEGGDCSQRWQ